MKIKKKKIITITVLAIIAGILVTAFILYWNNFRGIIPLIKKPSVDIAEVLPGSSKNINELNGENTPGDNKDEVEMDKENIKASDDRNSKDPENREDGSILKLEKDFSITIFADDVPAARVLAVGPEGNLWVSQTGIGQVSRIIILDGISTGLDIIFDGLKNPHGIAFDPEDPYMLYIAEEDRVSRVRIEAEGFPEGDLQKIIVFRK